MSGTRAVQSALRNVYFGDGRRAPAIAVAALGVDVLVIGFFIISPFLEDRPFFLFVDYAIAAVLALDLGLRAWAYGRFSAWIRRPIVWVDLFVLGTLLLPNLIGNFGFLRILRLWSLAHADRFWVAIGRDPRAAGRVEEVTKAGVSLAVFIFIMTGLVHVTAANTVDGFESYVDSLYFTVATLTTTGFGDLVLDTGVGKIIAVAIMLGGITLFLRLATVVVRPSKVYFPCPGCGLSRHEADAVHCKACGRELRIPHDND